MLRAYVWVFAVLATASPAAGSGWWEASCSERPQCSIEWRSVGRDLWIGFYPDDRAVLLSAEGFLRGSGVTAAPFALISIAVDNRPALVLAGHQRPSCRAQYAPRMNVFSCRLEDLQADVFGALYPAFRAGRTATIRITASGEDGIGTFERNITLRGFTHASRDARHP